MSLSYKFKVILVLGVGRILGASKKFRNSLGTLSLLSIELGSDKTTFKRFIWVNAKICMLCMNVHNNMIRIIDHSKKAISYLKIIKSTDKYSLVELNPITGRKHQLRKQLYAIGNPIYGDQKYKLNNSDKAINKNLMLHSYQIKFIIDDVKHTYTALLPDYFRKLLKTKRLRFPGLK